MKNFKFKLLLISSLLLTNIFNCNAQDYFGEISGKWILVNTHDFLDNEIESDLPYNRLTFRNDKTMEITPLIIYEGYESYIYNYKLLKDSLFLNFRYSLQKYKIDCLNQDTLILTNNLRKYYFVKYLDIFEGYNSTKIYLPYDTLEFISIRTPIFKTDINKYFFQNIIYSTKDTCSFSADVEFILRKSGHIDNVIVKSDSSVTNEIITKINRTNNKWNTFKVKNKKYDIRVKLKILIASPKIEEIKGKSFKNTFEKLYDKAYDFYNSENIDSAYYYLSECNTVYNFIESLNPYNSQSYHIDIKKIWIESVLMRSTILYSNKRNVEACKELERIVIFDKRAYDFYIQNCYSRKK